MTLGTRRAFTLCMFAIAKTSSSPIQEFTPAAPCRDLLLTPPSNSPAEAASRGCVTSDEALVERARKGDKLAFGELIQRHRNACLKRARLMIRDRSDAEDEVQNAFWKAFLRLEQYRGEGTFGAWLSRIVENQCLMRIRDERNVRFVYLDEPTESNVRLGSGGPEPGPGRTTWLERSRGTPEEGNLPHPAPAAECDAAPRRRSTCRCSTSRAGWVFRSPRPNPDCGAPAWK